MEIILFFLSVFATTIGSISGMGGGIMIKPAMDAISGLDVASISFMSGCTVLAMAMVSAYRGRKDELDINMPVTLPLALGSVVGGVLGKAIFSYIPGDRAFMQSTILFAIYVAIFFYVKVKDKVKSLGITKKPLCLLIGCCLGTVASFLGIGGGPINMAVLFYFMGSASKVAAKQSIFLILLSQTASFFTVLLTGLPENVNYLALALMIVGGCGGAVYGSNLSKKYSNAQVDTFFICTLIGVMILNLYNIIVMLLN